MARYFYTNSAARPLKFGPTTFKFSPVSVLAGRMAGVYEATDEAEINLLSNASQQKLGVSEITLEEYDRAKKKRPGTRSSSVSSLSRARPIQIPQLPTFSVAPKGGVASAAGTTASNSPQPTEVLPLPTVTSLMKLGKVNSPSSLVAEGDRLKTFKHGRWPEPSADAKKARAKAEKANA